MLPLGSHWRLAAPRRSTSRSCRGAAPIRRVSKRPITIPIWQRIRTSASLMTTTPPRDWPNSGPKSESGNVTWDIVDMVAADAITACDEGVIMEIDPDTWLAAAPDGTPASEDFFAGTLTPGGTNCFIPQIVYSTTFGYRTDVFEGEQPSTIADVFDLEKFPGKRSLERRPINNLEWALVADGVAPADVYGMLSTREGVSRALGQARCHQGSSGLVDQGSPAAAAAGGRRGRHGIGLQRSSLLGHRRKESAHRHDVGSADLRSRRAGSCRSASRISTR